jgi:hypothetical protein
MKDDDIFFFSGVLVTLVTVGIYMIFAEFTYLSLVGISIGAMLIAMLLHGFDYKGWW